MTKKNFVFSLICLLIFTLSYITNSSSADFSPNVSSALRDYSPSALKGWMIDKTNTGLAASKLSAANLKKFDLNGADKGQGEWIAGNGNILYLYGKKKIENRIITFTGYLKAPEGGTIIKNCIIRPTRCADGMSIVNVVGATIENCEIDGSLLGADTMHAGISATNSTIRNCLIHEVDCGVMAINDKGLTIIENNYIYNVLFPHGSDDHLAGSSIWAASGDGIGFFNNRIVIDDSDAVGHTSAAFFSQSFKGNICNVRVEGNLFISPGYVTRITESVYATYLPFSFINNRLQVISGGFGYYAGDKNIKITPTWKDNYIYNPKAPDAKGDLIKIK